MAFSENIEAFFSDFAVTATYNGETANVLFDMPDQIVAGDVVSEEYQITYATGHFSGLGYGAALTVNGVAYTVHYTQVLTDGKLTVARLTKV